MEDAVARGLGRIGKRERERKWRGMKKTWAVRGAFGIHDQVKTIVSKRTFCYS